MKSKQEHFNNIMAMILKEKINLKERAEFMEIIVGAIVVKNNKILMVKEAKKSCHGKWAFPAGHLEENETIFEGIKRETKEETGCDIELKQVFPIITNSKNIIMIHILADLVNDYMQYNKNEIIETKWIELEQLKKMKADELRSYSVANFIIQNLEKKKLYNLDIIQNLTNL